MSNSQAAPSPTEPTAEAPSPAPSLTAKTASGVLWSSAATVVGKASALVGQIGLAWLLMPEDFGLIALTYTVLTFTNLIRESGIRQVLIQRQAEYPSLAGPAFWLSATLGLLAGLVLLLIASPITALLDAPGLQGLLYICALAAPIDALGTVPSAKLQIALRFRFFAFQGLALSLWQMAITIVLAWYGAGAYSFVIAMVSTSGVRTAWLWMACGMQQPAPPRFGLWISLIRVGGIVTVAQLLSLVALQADRVILQIFHEEAVVGVYYLAFSLSLQTTTLLSYQLAVVLMPALSRIQNDPPRQRAAFVRAVELMMYAGVPICIAQSTFAEPIIRLLFSEKFHAAINPLQLLSLSMMFRLASMCGVSLLQAQGRFRAHAGLMALQVALVIPASMAGAHYGGAAGVALAVCCVSAVVESLIVAAALRGHPHRWQVTLAIYSFPILLCLPTFGPVFIAIQVYEVLANAPALQLLGGSVLAVSGYIAMLRFTTPTRWNSLMDLTRSVIHRSKSQTRQSTE